ncbi:MAG: hypothetical protein WAM41_00030 [Psychrobacillus psychrotolerans]
MRKRFVDERIVLKSLITDKQRNILQVLIEIDKVNGMGNRRI